MILFLWRGLLFYFINPLLSCSAQYSTHLSKTNIMNLKTLFILSLVCGGTFTVSCCSTHRESVYVRHTESRFTLIVMYDAIIGKKPLLKAMRKYKAQLLYDYKNFNGVAVSISKSYDEQQVIRFFKNTKGVLSVQRDRKMQLYDTIQ